MPEVSLERLMNIGLSRICRVIMSLIFPSIEEDGINCFAFVAMEFLCQGSIFLLFLFHYNSNLLYENS